MIMEKYAMIFAAGLGTRLGEISQTTPKALLSISGKPLIFHIIWKLKKLGFKNIVINIHHHAELIKNYLNTLKLPELNLQLSDETQLLLDTGGGLYKARHFFENADNILLHNVDIISTINLNQLWNEHIQSANIATLAVRQRETQRYLLFNDDGYLKGRINLKTKKEEIFSNEQLNPYAFSGIHVINKSIFSKMHKQSVYSITDLYLELAKDNKIGKFVHNNDYWIDVGKPENIIEAEKIANIMIESHN